MLENETVQTRRSLSIKWADPIAFNASRFFWNTSFRLAAFLSVAQNPTHLWSGFVHGKHDRWACLVSICLLFKG